MLVARDSKLKWSPSLTPKVFSAKAGMHEMSVQRTENDLDQAIVAKV